MPAGLQIKNTSGTIQIDENYENLVLISKGTVTTSNYNASTEVSEWTRTFSGRTTPLLALRSTQPFSGSSFIEPSSGSVTFSGYMKANAGAVLNWYLFDVCPSTNLPNAGLLVKKANGDIVFRSDYKPMRIWDVVNRTSSITKTYATGKTYAVVHGDVGFSFSAGGLHPFPRWYSTTFSTVNGNSVALGEVKTYYYQGASPAPGAFSRNGFSSIVVDVTNY